MDVSASYGDGRLSRLDRAFHTVGWWCVGFDGCRTLATSEVLSSLWSGIPALCRRLDSSIFHVARDSRRVGGFTHRVDLDGSRFCRRLQHDTIDPKVRLEPLCS